MSTFWILLEQMELFVIYILAGVILVKSRLFNRETLQPISKFVLRMGLPLLIFTNIINGVERNVLLSLNNPHNHKNPVFMRIANKFA